MLKSEPVPGRYYIVRSYDRKGRPEGASICKFKNREGRGCQLHGDRMGYYYHFQKYDDGITTVWVNYDENERDFSKVITQLNDRVRPYDSLIDPWSFELLPVKEKPKQEVSGER
jgi:hypothetical protein